jgi:hypothetical protein
VAFSFIFWLLSLYPPNSYFIGKFNRNKTDMELLRQMAVEERDLYAVFKHLGDTAYVLECNDGGQNCLTDHRKNEYVKLLNKLNVSSLYRIAENGTVEYLSFAVYRWGGSVAGGSLRSFNWYPVKPAALEWKDVNGITVTLVPLGDNWYLECKVG